MTTKRDSTISAIDWYIKRIVVLLALLLPLAGGCGDANSAASNAELLEGIDSRFLTQLGELQFVSDHEIGRQLGAERGRPCLLFFTAEWCSFCHRMENSAFVDQRVSELAKHFICIRVDADHDQEVCRQYDVSGYPTIQFLSAKGQTLHRLVGRQSPDNLALGMQAALERFAWLEEADTQTR